MPLLRRPLRHTAISLNTLPVARKYPNSRGGAVFFHGGDFDPGGRGDASSSALGRRGVPFAVFDQPRGLTEHWAAGTEQFAQRCGGYITGFLNNGLTPDDGVECEDGRSGGPPGPVVLPAPRASVGRLER